MSQFSSPTPPGAARLRRLGAAPEVGIVEQLRSPGLHDAAVDTTAAKLTDDLLGALGLAGHLAGHLTQEARHKEAEQKRLDTEFKHTWEGEADMDANQALPLLRDKIARGEIPVPETPAEAATMANELVAQQYAGTSRPQVYQDRLRRHLVKPVETWLLAARNGKIAQETEKNDAALSVRLETAGSDEDINSVLDEARKLEGNADSRSMRIGPDGQVRRTTAPVSREDQIVDQVLFPAAHRLALRGQTEQLGRLLSRLPPRLATQAAELEKHGQTERNRLDTRNEAETAAQVLSLVDDARTLSEETGAIDYQPALDEIGSAQADGRLGEKRAFQLRTLIRSSQRQDEHQAKTRRLQVEKDTAHRQYDSENDALAAVGMAAAIPPKKVKLTDGTDYTLVEEGKNDAAILATMQRGVARIMADPRVSGEGLPVNGDAKWEAIQEFSHSNGMLPPGVKPQIEAGADSINEMSAADGKISPIGQLGYGYYLQIRSKTPELLPLAGKAEALNLYDRAWALESSTPVGASGHMSPEQALYEARRQIGSGKRFGPSETAAIGAQAKIITGMAPDPISMTTSKASWLKDVRNVGDVAAVLFAKAQNYPSLSPADAVTRASAQLERTGIVVRHNWSEALLASVPASLQPRWGEVVTSWVDDFSKQHHQDLVDAGVNPDTVTAHYDPNNGHWTMVDEDGHALPPIGQPGEKLIRNDALLQRETERQDKAAVAALDANIAGYYERRHNPTGGSLPRQYSGESDADYARRLGRKRPGEL